jgi:hypothetical protein
VSGALHSWSSMETHSIMMVCSVLGPVRVSSFNYILCGTYKGQLLFQVKRHGSVGETGRPTKTLVSYLYGCTRLISLRETERCRVITARS